MPIDNYKYTETLGFVLTLVRLDESGLYICRTKENPNQVLHFSVDVMESCEFLLLMNGTNNCHLGKVTHRHDRRLLLLPTSTDRSRPESSSPSGTINGEGSTDWNGSYLLASLVSLLPETTNPQTFRTSRNSNSVLNNSIDYATRGATTARDESHSNSNGDGNGDFDVTTASGSSSSSGISSGTTTLSSGVGPIKLSEGNVIGYGSHSLDPFASPPARSSQFEICNYVYLCSVRILFLLVLLSPATILQYLVHPNHIHYTSE